MCLALVLFGCILFGTFCTSWTCMSISITRLGKFSVTIFSNRFSISCPLSSPSSTFKMQILVHLTLFQRLYPHFFFSVLIGCFLLLFILNHCFDSQLYLLHCWFPVNYSSYQSVYPLFPTGSFYGFHVIFYAVTVLSSSTLPLNSLRILTTSVLNSASGRLLVPI